MESHWLNTQRVMGEVLKSDEQPRNVWSQHEAMLETIVEGDGIAAERLGREHITQAADFMIARLMENMANNPAQEEAPAGKRKLMRA